MFAILSILRHSFVAKTTQSRPRFCSYVQRVSFKGSAMHAEAMAVFWWMNVLYEKGYETNICVAPTG